MHFQATPDPGWVGMLRAPHARLFRKYALVFASLMGGALILTAAASTYFSYSENLSALARLQEEQAASAGATIELFLDEIERQIAWTGPPARADASSLIDQRQ